MPSCRRGRRSRWEIGACADEAAAARRRRRFDRRRRRERGAVVHGAAVGSMSGSDRRAEAEPWFDVTVATAGSRDGSAARSVRSGGVGRGRRPVGRPSPPVPDRLRASTHGPSRLSLQRRPAGRRARALRSAHAIATSIRAGRLLPEIEALAAHARIDLALDEAPTSSMSGGSSVEVASMLTPRESAVLRLVAAGHTNREIGDLPVHQREDRFGALVTHAMNKLGALSLVRGSRGEQRHGLLRP